MKLYQHPESLFENLNLLIQHDVYLGYQGHYGPMFAYCVGYQGTHVIVDSINDVRQAVFGESTIVKQEPFYMCFAAWSAYKRYHNERY
jgi:hypothetical protein